MSTNNFFKSNLFNIYNIVQASMIVYPKEVIIDTLRDYYSRDDYYHFSKDQWGFPNTVDMTDIPLGADLPYGPGANPALNPNPILPTRLFIGENYRYDGIYYPAILVKSGGTRYVPISINREKTTVHYKEMIYGDGYGNETLIRRPESFITAGIWEGSIIIDILTRSLCSRDDLAETMAMFFTEIAFEDLKDVGVIVKPLSISSTSETNDRNDKLFKQTITLDIRTEWRREIPVGDTIDAILFTVYFQDLLRPNSPIAANLTINSEVELTESILNW